MATDGNGLRAPLPKKGLVRCLRCDHFFYSVDRCRVRVCPHCHNGEERLGVRAEDVIEVHGVDLQILERDED